MSESQRIAGQMLQACEGEAWHGPCMREVLEGVTPEMALARPIPGAHSIWEIVLHLTATERLLLRRLNRDQTLLTNPPAEWPPLDDTRATEWPLAVRALLELDAIFREQVARFPDDQLDEPLLLGGTSAYNNFHGYVQHHLYHLGQIALLKKMLTP
jgi:hypothetical protein